MLVMIFKSSGLEIGRVRLTTPELAPTSIYRMYFELNKLWSSESKESLMLNLIQSHSRQIELIRFLIYFCIHYNVIFSTIQTYHSINTKSGITRIVFDFVFVIGSGTYPFSISQYQIKFFLTCKTF